MRRKGRRSAERRMPTIAAQHQQRLLWRLSRVARMSAAKCGVTSVHPRILLRSSGLSAARIKQRSPPALRAPTIRKSELIDRSDEEEREHDGGAPGIGVEPAAERRPDGDDEIDGNADDGSDWHGAYRAPFFE